jgi:hypothetical protein
VGVHLVRQLLHQHLQPVKLGVAVSNVAGQWWLVQR